MAVATNLATLPSMTSVADAGPVDASSDGLEPGIFGKVLGSVSQMRPHAVSVWLVGDPPLPAVAGDAADVAAGVEARGDAEDEVDEQAASAKATVTARPITRRPAGEWRGFGVIGGILP